MSFDLDRPLPALPAITQDKIKLYLAYLETSGRKRYSAMMAGIEPNSLWRFRKKDTDLQELELAALQGYCEVLEGEAHRRAVDGVPKAVWFKGEKCGEDVVYSDTLLMAMMKARDPKYRNQGEVDVNVKAGVLVVHQSIDPDDWEQEYGQSRTAEARPDSISVQPSETGADEAD